MKKPFTKLSDSYVKHFCFSRTKWVEGKANQFDGWMTHDGEVAGTMINSYGELSVLQGKVYRLLFLRLLIGRATGYSKFPNGAPYIQFGIATRKNILGILLAERGVTYIKVKRTKIS